jgi:hypothetical protein
MAARHERGPEISWVLQIQYKATGPWHDHTSGLYRREDADEFLAECQADWPENRYRLVRETTTYAVEPAR